ncbi:hypothetical protein QJQ45_008202 [Haematococcus lacustris]|nr:hypothetical protein QJQ45_008202 [Haematococcus lacustris]
MPSDEQRAAAVAVRDSVTARQQQQQVDSKRLKELEDTARGVYNRFEPPLPALRSKGMTVEELKHLSQKLGLQSIAGFKQGASLGGCLCNAELVTTLNQQLSTNALAKSAGVTPALIQKT